MCSNVFILISVCCYRCSRGVLCETWWWGLCALPWFCFSCWWGLSLTNWTTWTAWDWAKSLCVEDRACTTTECWSKLAEDREQVTMQGHIWAGPTRIFFCFRACFKGLNGHGHYGHAQKNKQKKPRFSILKAALAFPLDSFGTLYSI